MIKIILLQSILLGFNAYAELDKSSQEALEKTMEQLKNPAQREQALKENPKYKEGESGANLLVKGDATQKQQIYEMAAEVLQTLVQKANGDPVKMQEIVSKAQKDPGKFMEEYFSEAQKKQVRDLAGQIEKDRQPKAQPPAK